MGTETGWVTLPDGRKVKLGDGGGKKKGGGAAVAAVAAVAIAAVSSGATVSGLAGSGSSTGGGTFAENVAGDVVDGLPGRSLPQRTAKARESAKRGDWKESWSRMKMKELRHKIEHEAECLSAATGRVREFLARTPCTSLDRMLLAVGDGHDNAAVVSVVRVGFKSAKHRNSFQDVETEQGSGDVRPLEISLALGVAGVSFTGLNYRDRRDKNALVVAEADTATGHLDGSTLKALADVARFMPVA
ncbi:hypothetical protein [Amycolatopsis sp. NPDC054798]